MGRGVVKDMVACNKEWKDVGVDEMGVLKV